MTKSSLLKNYVGLDFETFQKQRYILKTSLQGSLERKKASQIGFSKIKPEGRGVKKISVMKTLRYLIGERQIKMDILETTIEVSAEELLANESTFENKTECRALLKTLCEIENEIKELSNHFKPLIGDDAAYKKEVNDFVSKTYSYKIISKTLVVSVFIRGLSYLNSC